MVRIFLGQMLVRWVGWWWDDRNNEMLLPWTRFKCAQMGILSKRMSKKDKWWWRSSSSWSFFSICTCATLIATTHPHPLQILNGRSNLDFFAPPTMKCNWLILPDLVSLLEHAIFAPQQFSVPTWMERKLLRSLYRNNRPYLEHPITFLGGVWKDELSLIKLIDTHNPALVIRNRFLGSLRWSHKSSGQDQVWEKFMLES